MGLFSGTRPDELGVRGGRLAPPKRTPNNVNSQTDKSDTRHYIEPLRYSGDAREAWSALARVVASMPRVRVVKAEPGYLYAEFTSALMGFVDDTEFYLDEKAGVIQVRSASRLGRGDHGVNRARVEAIRAALAQARGQHR